MGRTLKLATTLAGEAAGALMSSPPSPRSCLPGAAPRQLQRMAVRRRRDGRIGLETILEEDPSLDSEANEECFYTSGKSSHAAFRDKFGGGLGIKNRQMSPFVLFFLFLLIPFVVAFSYGDNQ